MGGENLLGRMMSPHQLVVPGRVRRCASANKGCLLLTPVSKKRRSREGKSRVAEFLDEHGFYDVGEKQTRFLRSSYPLHVAVKANDPEMVLLLIGSGADPLARDSAKRTPLQLA